MSSDTKYNVFRMRETRIVGRVLDGIIRSTTPLREIMSVINRAHDHYASPFEVYAGTVLADAGASRLNGIVPVSSLRVLSQDGDRQVRLVCTVDSDDGKRNLILRVESALNRLLMIREALEHGVFEPRDEEERRIGVSAYGASFLKNEADVERNSVQLPAIKPTEHASYALFHEIDWRCVENIAARSHAILQNAALKNRRQTVLGAYAPGGSDWDVRTRLAALLESLELPFPWSYRFDCNVAANAAAVSFTSPSLEMFPRSTNNPLMGKPASGDSSAENARLCYAIRLAVLMASACFGAGRNIDNAYAICRNQDDSKTVFQVRFERNQFVKGVLSRVDDGSISDPKLRFDPQALFKLILNGEEDLDTTREDDPSVQSAIPQEFADQRIPVHLDTRELPEKMQMLFCAHRIDELDTATYFGPQSTAIDEARADADDSPLAAIARLEGVVDELTSLTYPPDDDADARPLYCGNPYARLMISLLRETSAVSRDAEAFLQGEPVLNDNWKPPYYFRAPSALYHAYMGLSDLYERIGDLRGAEAQADKCLALAPTTVDAHFRKAHLLAQQRRFTEAANVIISALDYAVSYCDCSLLYYHLALLLWNLNRQKDAAAVFVYAASLSGDYAEKAKKVVNGLKKKENIPVIVHASPRAAIHDMRQQRIPVAPSDSVLALIAQAALGLSCAQAPCAAEPYAHSLAGFLQDDAVIVSACRSLEHGIDW